MKTNFRKRAIIVVATILMMSIVFISFSDKDFRLIKNLDIFYSLFKELNYFYVDETDPEKLIKTGIDEMLKSLDPYTTYIPESEMDNFNFITTGQYGGIGALIRRGGDYTIVSDPYEHFPAANSDLRAGDTIIAIDGKSIKGLKLSKVSERLKGIPGTKVKVTIIRTGQEKSFNKTLIREKVKINNVPYYGMLDEKIGYIRLSNFTQGASIEVKAALDFLKIKNAEGIILDLRGNPGGLLIESVRIANVFTSKNLEIVSTKGKVKQWDKVYKTENNPTDTIIPLSILVSRGSASASEIVAGSLQDLDRAVIVGQRTFGKGLVQTTRPLSYNSQLKVTTAKYYIPSGRCIQALDYSHRNKDGSVGYIPDSLISEFTTRNERKVYDGGGITPDIKIKPESISKLTISLYNQNLIFNYATEYRNDYDSILPVDSFLISNNDYDNFISFAQKKNFEYETESDIALKNLIKTAKDEKYYNQAKSEFDTLAFKLKHNLRNDLLLFQDEISEILREEIIGRYYYQKGRIEASVENDSTVLKAADILKDIEKREGILTGTLDDEGLVLR